VYDMYPWDKYSGCDAVSRAEDRPGARLPTPRHGRRPLTSGNPAGPAAAARPAGFVGPARSGARAVQIALDRRDNGGAAAATAVPAGAIGEPAADWTASKVLA
jgi:hypothetical protein